MERWERWGVFLFFFFLSGGRNVRWSDGSDGARAIFLFLFLLGGRNVRWSDGARVLFLFFIFSFSAGEPLGGAMGAMGRVFLFFSPGGETLGGAMGAMGRVLCFLFFLFRGGGSVRWSDGSDGARFFFFLLCIVCLFNRFCR